MAKLINLSNLCTKITFNSACHQQYTRSVLSISSVFTDGPPDLDAPLPSALQRKFWVVGFSSSASKEVLPATLPHRLVLTRSLHLVKSLFWDLCIGRVSRDWVKPAWASFRTDRLCIPTGVDLTVNMYVSPSCSPSL